MQLKSSASLPPQVKGPTKGFLNLIFGTINWSSTASKSRPSNLFARIKWWGDVPEAKDDIPLQAASTSISFPLKSAAHHVSNYLQDLGTLEILILEDSDAPKAIAKASLDTAALVESGSAFCQQELPVVGYKSGITLGSLPVHVEILYAAPSTSNAEAEAVAEAATQVLNMQHQLEPPVSAKPPEKEPYPKQDQNDNRSPIEVPSPAVDVPLASVQTEESAGSGLMTEAAAGNGPEGENRREEQNASQMPHRLEESKEQQHCVTARIESAFQLPAPPLLPSHSHSEPFFVYASAVWQKARSRRVNTHLAAAHEVPAAGGHAVVWRSVVDVQVNLEDFKTAAEGDIQGLLDGPLLLLNVWRSGLPPPDPAVFLESLSLSSPNKPPAEASPFDKLIGCAAIDLTTLLHQNEMEDRFQLVNAQHQVQGVIKACIKPNKHLEVALQSLKKSSGTDDDISRGLFESAMVEDDEVLDINIQRAVLDAQHGTVRDHIEITKATFSTREVPVQQYAWSGSDSDDDGAMGMVGMAFEGAVSCDEEEDAVDDETEERKNKAPMLVTQDWMFDICKSAGEEGQQGDGSDSRVIEDKMQVDAGLSGHQKERKPVVFKNRLLPGVVVPTGGSVFSASFLGFRDADPMDEGADDQVVVDKQPYVVPSAVIEQVRRPPDAHHPSLNGDWLFGINSSGRANLGPQPRSGPPPAMVTASQFAPMEPSGGGGDDDGK